MPKPLKLYIDTSVWNFALERKRHEYFFVRQFLRLIKDRNAHSICVSDLVQGEIMDAHTERKSFLQDLIAKYKPINLEATEESFKLATIYVSLGIISRNHQDDAMHIAIASVNKCDYIVSCNYKHIVRAKTIHGVHIINQKKGYDLLEIVSPREFVGK